MSAIKHPVVAAVFAVCFAATTYFTYTYRNCGILTLSAVLAAQGALLLVLYRLTIHPLAGYAGPWYAAIAEAHNIYSCLSGDRHLQFKKWHDRYGPVVRYAPNRLSFCDEKAISDIYGVRANTRKSSVFGGVNHVFGSSATFTEIDRRVHGFKRSVISQGFHPTHLKDYASVVLGNLGILSTKVLRDVGKEWSEPYDLSQLMKNLFADMMGDIIFSSRWNVQTSDSKRWILDMLPGGTAGLHAAGHMLFTLKLGLPYILLPKTMQDVQRFLDLSRTQCKERLEKVEEPNGRRDLFSSIIQEGCLKADTDSSRKYGFTMKDLITEAGFLMIAGGDTTATTATAILFYLLTHPKILEDARKELQLAFPRGTEHCNVQSVAAGETLNECRLLYACIEETMRLSPPVGGPLPREVLSGGLSISNKWMVPAGIDVSVPIYAVHHSEQFWENPNKFEPQRWLLGKLKDTQNTFMPFGVGRASCLGKQLAYMEVALVTAHILEKYELEMIPMSQKKDATMSQGKGKGEWGRGNDREFQARDVFTSDHVGPLVRLRCRQ